MMSCKFSFILVLLLAVVLPQGVHGAFVTQETSGTHLSSTANRQVFGCNNRCFIRRQRANRQCARLRRRGGSCSIRECVRTTPRFPEGRPGFQCAFISGPPATTTTTGTAVVVVAPTATATTTATPSPSVTPTVSPSVTPSTTPSPSASVTPSATPSVSVTPTSTPSCEFTLSGQIGEVAVDGICRCGSSTASVTFLDPVQNNGTPLGGGIEAAALDCYLSCVGDIIDNISCTPSSFSTFSSNGQTVIDTCCESCATDNGEGVDEPTRQCRLNN